MNKQEKKTAKPNQTKESNAMGKEEEEGKKEETASIMRKSITIRVIEITIEKWKQQAFSHDYDVIQY